MNNKIKIFLLLSLLSMLFFVGCSAEGIVTVYNDTNGELYVSLDGGSEETISSGSSRDFSTPLQTSLLQSETKEVTLEIYGWYKETQTYKETVTADSSRSINITADSARLLVVNNSSYTMDRLYCVSDFYYGWGSDILSTTIAPYGGARYWWASAGNYDIRIYSTNNIVWDNIDSEGYRISALVLSIGKTREVVLTNTTIDWGTDYNMKSDNGDMISKSMTGTSNVELIEQPVR